MPRVNEAWKLVIAVAIFAAGMSLVFWCTDEWIARQTWAVLFTGLVVIWYTWETMQLRRATFAQRELQLRPFVVAEKVGDDFVLKNLGPGAAINVSIEDVVLSEEDEIGVRFPESISILPCGESASISSESYHGEADMGHFFAANLDPEYTDSEIDLCVKFQDTEMKEYAVIQRVKPGTMEISGLSSYAL